MKVSRRRFLLGASTLAIYIATPALAGLHFHGTSGFNGGRSQVGLGPVGNPGMYPFINCLKTDGKWFKNPNVSTVDLSSDGYFLLSATGAGAFLTADMPSQNNRPGKWVIDWEGEGQMCFITNSVVYDQFSGDSFGTIGSFQGRLAVTSVSDVGHGGGFYGKLVVRPGTGFETWTNFQPLFLSQNDANPIHNIRAYHIDDAVIVDTQVFGIKFKQKLAEANFGALRFLDWMNGNTTNVVNWADRKPITYVGYNVNAFPLAIYAGTTTRVGTTSAFTVSAPPGWAGLVDKAKVGVLWSATTTDVNITATVPGASTVFTAPGHAITVGMVINVRGYFVAGGDIGTVLEGADMTVTGVSGNDITVSVNSTGLAVVTAFQPVLFQLPSLNVGGTGAIGIKDPNASNLFPANYPKNNGAQATLVYDAGLNRWLQNFENSGTISYGINNQVPPELLIRLCNEMGAHPWFTMPYYAMDAQTDYITGLATLCKTTLNAALIPRFETGNEIWNFVQPITNYAAAKARALFGGPSFSYNDMVGKWASTMAQQVSGVYAADRTKYYVVCGFQSLGNAVYPDARLESSAYVGIGGSAAKNWINAVCFANYFSSAYYGLPYEGSLAYQYVNGTASAPATYVGTVGSATGVFDPAGHASVPVVNGFDTSWCNFAASYTSAGHTMKGMNYEGGYSPDYTNFQPFNMDQAVTTATSSPATVTVDALPNAFTGMTITLSGIGGITGMSGNFKVSTMNVGGNPNKFAITNTDGSAVVASGTYTSGGFVNISLSVSQANIDTLRTASKNVSSLTDAIASNYANLISSGGIFPSCFYFAGTDAAWPVLDPNIYVTNPPQFQAFITFNH